MEKQEIEFSQSHGLTPEEELELEQLEKKSHSQKALKGVILGTIIVLVVIVTFGVLRLYPFLSKFEGTWIDSETGNYIVENKGKQSTFKIENIQDSPNLTLLFKGELYGTASNRYKSKNNELFLEVYKKDFPNEVMEEFKKAKESYQVVQDDAEILLLKYTDQAVKAAFGSTDVDHLFYYELTEFGYGVKGKRIKMRNTEFAKNTLTLSREKHE
ncbi:hypothetical protein [Vagococcus sp.]|uniref:hypothetical protein n=1 Tax=Vagococcus sp. TaxID=1933889 RepID=UPI003F9B84DC